MAIRRKDADMTQGSIWKHLITFAIPMAIGLIFQQLYNTVDAVVVGNFVGEAALAAVGSTSSIINMLVGLSAGLSTGASVVISQLYGAHENERLREAVHTTIAVTFILCAIATAVGILLVDPMLHMMQTPDNVFPEAKLYLTIYFGGITGLLVYNMGSAILRAVGDSRRPLYFLIFSAVTNTILDIIYVVVFKMGVAGVGLATVLAQMGSASLVLYALSHDNAAYGIRWRQIRINGGILKQFFNIGLPSGVQQGLTSFSNVFVQSYINAFGSAVMAGWSAHNKLDAFVSAIAQSVSMASTTFVGQNYGAKDIPRARKGVKSAVILSICATMSMSALVMILAPTLISFFSPEAEVIAHGVKFINICTPFYVFLCLNQIQAGALRGTGNAKRPMTVMLFSFVLFRQMYLFAISRLFPNNMAVVAMGYPMGWMMATTLLYLCYRKSPLGKHGTQEKQRKNTAAA